MTPTEARTELGIKQPNRTRWRYIGMGIAHFAGVLLVLLAVVGLAIAANRFALAIFAR